MGDSGGSHEVGEKRKSPRRYQQDNDGRRKRSPQRREKVTRAKEHKERAVS